MLLVLLPLVLTGVGLAFLMGDDSEDSNGGPEQGEEQALEELNLTRNADTLDLDTTEADIINAFEGDDTITADEDVDVLLRLGEGNDVVQLQGGTAEILAREGDDTVSMADGSLFVSLGLGNDLAEQDAGALEAFGGGGDDTILGGALDDWIDGGAGPDSLNGHMGDDEIFGNFGNDLMDGGPGDDFLFGDQGNDTMTDMMGFDTLIGGTGNDVMRTDGVGDQVFGYSGNDDLTGVDTMSDDPAGATLDGGAGDDDILGDLDATMTGAGGADDFTVATYAGDLGDPAVVTDFDPSLDTLTLDVDPTDFGDPATDPLPLYTVSTQVVADGVDVLINGLPYVKLLGLSSADGLVVDINEITASV